MPDSTYPNGLIRAYALNGRLRKSSYLNVLTFWKDADADTPTPKQAKAEYTKTR